jgi:sugar (pentulose or hexulose) kinase
MTQKLEQIFVGIDMGTSGCRGCAIDITDKVLAECFVELPAPRVSGVEVEQEPIIWWEALKNVLTQLCDKLSHPITALSIDGTSGSVLAVDKTGAPLGPALMYNDARASKEAEYVHHLAPINSGAFGVTSSLAKWLWLIKHLKYEAIHHVLHQADWLAGKLTGRFDISDENNSLKMGYDIFIRHWPTWMQVLGFNMNKLPQVQPPGTLIKNVKTGVAKSIGLSPETLIFTGTTDSIAAFIATGADQVGDAVTSLGSTLAVKVVANRPVFSPRHGVYSHRLWGKWLAGGASNTGGAVLLKYFTLEQLAAMTPQLRPEQPTQLDYYPLICKGERFPNANPQLQGRLEPRPDDDIVFFQGMLEGIARIEAEGYKRLEYLGAPHPNVIYTSGGGAKNQAWTQIRQKLIGGHIQMRTPQHIQAAYGTAILAKKGFLSE